MAIAYVSAASDSDVNDFPSSTPHAQASIVVGSESDRLLVIYVGAEYTGTPGGDVDVLTLNGTDIQTNFVRKDDATYATLETFYVDDSQLSTIGTGTHDLNVEINTTGTPSSNLEHIGLTGQYFSGVDQTGTILDAEAGGTAGSRQTEADFLITPATTGNWLLTTGIMSRRAGAMSLDLPSGGSVDFDVQDSGGQGNTAAGHDTGSGNSQFTVEWTCAGGDLRYATSGQIFREATGGGGSQSISPGQITENETLFAVTVTPGEVSQGVNQITENESLFAVAATSGASVSVGQIIENESLFPVSPNANISVQPGQVIENETLFAVNPDTAILIQTGQITENESLFAVTPVGSGGAVTGTITEEENLFAVSDGSGGTAEGDTIQDAILAATGEATVSAGKAAHFGRLDGEHIQDAEYRWLVSQGATPGQLQDMWVELFGPGHVNDVKLAYWQSQI